MAVNDIGRVTPIWRGFYSAERAYELNDIVLDAGGSVWWHVSEEITTGTAPGSGETWAAVIDMRIFSAAIQTAIAEAQAAVEAAEAARSGVTADADRAETAAENAETYARNASESAAAVGAYAQAAEEAKTAAQTAASGAQAAQSGAESAKTGAQTAQSAAETAKTEAQTAATQAAGSAETASGAAAVVEQKKAEAVAAVEAKGAEVLASIPEDYTELSGDVGDLHESLENAQSGLVDIGATWDRGTLTSGGNYSASLNYRVATKEKCTLQYDTNISVNDGFRVYYYIFGDTLYKSGWVTSAKIPKGSVVTVLIARSTDDTSETADIETFVSNVNFTNNVKAELDSASGLSKIAYSNTAPLNITAERISDNEYYQINADGSIGQTTSVIGVSDRIFCVGGDTLKYTLSTATGKLILAVFNASHQMTHSVTGTGYANYLTGEYTFTDDDAYFYVSGSLSRIANYSVEYGNVPAIISNLSESVEEIKTAYPVLPSYWSEYLDEKYPVLWQKDALIGAGGDSFVFVTDVHYERNAKNSPMLIQNIVKNTAVKTVFNGGDTLDEGDTVALAIEKLSAWQGMMDGMRVFNIVGNHDNNNYNSQNPTGVLTMGQFYGIMVKPSEQWIDTNGKIYYCVDNPSQKIRYICLAIEAFANVSDGSEQKTWLESKLTELSSDWSIVILQHRIWGSTTDDIAGKAQEVINIVNNVWNNINADFIGIIAGHTHLDYSTTEPVNGYLLIACNCDTLAGNNSGYTRTAGTTSEQSFDVFHIDKANKHLYATRIGAGTDRDWSYQ